MSTTCELAYHRAARHHECAAYHYKEAAKQEVAGMYEKAAHHAYLAHGHTQHAIYSEVEAAKLHADRFLHVDHCASSGAGVGASGAGVGASGAGVGASGAGVGASRDGERSAA
jgi:hypothetical protein